MSNLIERLREAARYYDNEGRPEETVMGIAADEIERLEKDLSHWKYVAADYEISCTQQRVERLEGALLVIYEMGAQSDYHLVQEMSKIAKEALGKEQT